MNTLIALAAAGGGYLIGSLSFARIITALFSPRTGVPEQTALGIEGSDKKLIFTSISATSVSANVGAGGGFLTFLLDVLKVFIPVMLLKYHFPGQHYHLITAAAGVTGHIWPVYHRFKGGRGISSIYGGILAIDWLGIPVAALGSLLVGLVILRNLYFTYMAGLWLLVPWLWFRTHDAYVILYLVFVNVLFTIATLPEMRQYFRLRKEAHWSDPFQAWQVSAMGRGIARMASRLGLIKRDRE
jgi:glycerol-3-phosphate acyltransferase PlsY